MSSIHTTERQEVLDLDATKTAADGKTMTQQCPPTSESMAYDAFVRRHIGPDQAQIDVMLSALGYASLDDLADAAIPPTIRFNGTLDLPEALTEQQSLEMLSEAAGSNTIMRSFIGMGYANCITPPVIQRNILENPGWYTAYTPYQAEIAQGRLEALLNFQTMIADLTGLPLANASLLDESTACAEAMTMCLRISKNRDGAMFLDAAAHPQTIGVVQARADAIGVELVVGDLKSFDPSSISFAGVLIQYPATDGALVDHRDLITRCRDAGAVVAMAVDPLAMAMCATPGELGADIAVGSSQRFGVPMGGGGPHAGFIATSEKHARKIPGRIIGVSRDAHGRQAYRMAIQTREQHIKRERATSNICTAQVLLAVMAGMYAVYHGPEGIREIADRANALARTFASAANAMGHSVRHNEFFDTVRVDLNGLTATDVQAAAAHCGINIRVFDDNSIGVAFDEVSDDQDLFMLLGCLCGEASDEDVARWIEGSEAFEMPANLTRSADLLTHEIFNKYHSEPEMTRYMARLQSRDLSLTHSMIPLGSCTMKLNGTAQMMPVSWPEFASMHPFAPDEQFEGYSAMFRTLEQFLAEITGFHAVSLMPNSGAQGEYAGLLVIRACHLHNKQANRRICIIPTSAHGTNPASAVAAGFDVVTVRCLDNGAVDLDHLRELAVKHHDDLGAFMITYPSTFGVFDQNIREMCDIIHEHGGLVYLDGANMNAQVGLCRPGDYGGDVCHLNLHKTFCIPHGGGGPGMGPICCTEQLAPFLPTHPVCPPDSAGEHAIGPVAGAPYGSPSILPISFAYIAMMAADGLKRASQVAMLSANYMAKRLVEHYDVLYRGNNGLCAHEFIIDCRPFDKSAGIKIDDIAKRLMDFGFHAPTMSWPVPGTLMIEPTESESLAELDRFVDALITIRNEIRDIEEGRADREDNVLRNAPHTVHEVSADTWDHAYSRGQAAFPAEHLRTNKFWPPVSRVDNPFGDRNLVCSCPPLDAYED